MRKELRTRMYGWWYLAIAGGFALLALGEAIGGASVARIAMHCVLGAAFLVAGIFMLRPRNL